MGSNKLTSIMEMANRLTVDDIAQAPLCGGDETTAVDDVCASASHQGFDWLPLKDPDGIIRRMVEVAKLEGVKSWKQARSRSEVIGVERIVAGSAPMFSILDRFDDPRPLMCLGPKGIDRIVTVYDLNQPAAHHFGFALALVVEAEVTAAIEESLTTAEHDLANCEGVILACGVRPTALKYWHRDRSLALVPSLSFEPKLTVLKTYGLEALVKRVGSHYSSAKSVREQLLRDLADTNALRDAVAHELPIVRKHDQVHQWLRTAHWLATVLSGHPAPHARQSRKNHRVTAPA